ncbi:YgiW/YdeI family stress tolerance OB fold protein [Ursidibacter arcticus]
MKKLSLITTLVLSTISVSALASGFKGTANGGFTNNAQTVSRVTDIKDLRDDQYIVLQGKIVKQLTKDDFLFRDASGEIVVEIDKDDWGGTQVGPNDEIRIFGEVDKSWNKTEVDVHRVEKVQ